MAFWTSSLQTLTSTFRHGRLWLLQFFGNALLLLAFVGFLHIPDAHVWQFIFSVIVMVLLVIAVPVLHGGTINYFLETEIEKKSAIKPPFRNALRHVLPLIIWMVVFYFLRALLDRLDDYQYSFPGYLRSEFPAWLRRIISEPAIRNLYICFVGFLRWVLLPGLLLPLALLCADKNFRGFLQLRAWKRMLCNLGYWIVLIIAALIGVYCTGKILDWTLNPRTATLGSEEIWLGFRLIVAYLLMIFSWLWVCAMLARARLKADSAAQKSAA